MTDSYRIALEPRAIRHLERIDRVARQRIASAIDALSTDPAPRGCKPLKGQTSVLRIRVGDYRILYAVGHRERTVLIIDIDHRKDIYRP